MLMGLDDVVQFVCTVQPVASGRARRWAERLGRRVEEGRELPQIAHVDGQHLAEQSRAEVR